MFAVLKEKFYTLQSILWLINKLKFKIYLYLLVRVFCCEMVCECICAVQFVLQFASSVQLRYEY